jgi:hypothetical protein
VVCGACVAMVQLVDGDGGVVVRSNGKDGKDTTVPWSKDVKEGTK